MDEPGQTTGGNELKIVDCNDLAPLGPGATKRAIVNLLYTGFVHMYMNLIAGTIFPGLFRLFRKLQSDKMIYVNQYVITIHPQRLTVCLHHGTIFADLGFRKSKNRKQNSNSPFF